MSVVLIAGGAGGGGLEMDAVLQISPKQTSTITSHPTEQGSSISDHIYKNNVVIDIMGDFACSSSSGYAAEKDVSSWGLLNKAWEERSPLTVVSRFKVYEDCYITSLIPLDETDTGETLRVSLTLEQIRFASLEQTTAPVKVASGRKDNVKGKTDTGLKTPKERESARSEVVRSTIKGVQGE